MFHLGLNVVSGVAHWMAVRLGLTLQYNALVQPKQTMNNEEVLKGLYQDPEDVQKN